MMETARPSFDWEMHFPDRWMRITFVDLLAIGITTRVLIQTNDGKGIPIQANKTANRCSSSPVTFDKSI